MASGEVGKKEKGNPSVKPTFATFPFRDGLKMASGKIGKKEEDITPHLSLM
jgi:hypothetical protein